MISVSLIKSFDKFRKIKKVWNHLVLESKCVSVFTTFDWVNMWINCFNIHRNLFIIIVKDNHKYIGIAPFYLSDNRTIKFLGDGISDYGSIIASKKWENVVYYHIFNYLLTVSDKWNSIALNEVSEKNPLINYIANNLKYNQFEYVSSTASICPHIILGESWNDYYKKLNRKFRRNLRNAQNLLDKASNFQFFINLKTISPEIQQKLLAIHRKRMIHKNKRRRSESFYQFIMATITNFTTQITPSISILTINGAIAAYGIGYIYQDTLYYWNMATG